jgi:hypothetical protein
MQRKNQIQFDYKQYSSISQLEHCSDIMHIATESTKPCMCTAQHAQCTCTQTHPHDVHTYARICHSLSSLQKGFCPSQGFCFYGPPEAALAAGRAALERPETARSPPGVLVQQRSNHYASQPSKSVSPYSNPMMTPISMACRHPNALPMFRIQVPVDSSFPASIH